MGALIALAIACLIVMALSSPTIKRLERRRAMEIAKIKKTQAEQQRREIELMREQMRQRREQERLAKEQEKQAAQLAKHEAEIAKLNFRMQEAESTILFEQKRLDNLTGQLSALDDQIAKLDIDIKYAELAHEVDKGNRAKTNKERVQKKIFSLEEKVYASERRIAKAQFDKEQAQRKLSA